MNLKTFLQENNVTGFETIPGVIIMNVLVGDATYAMDVDTSNIQAGTSLTRTEQWAVENDILTVDGISLNINETNMMSFPDTFNL
jgi:hypothetical protein